MRLWSIHPKYLDPQGLVACWREALLASKVISGETKGYKHHPQLIRFRATIDAQAAINAYLQQIHIEANKRGYNFDNSKIKPVVVPIRIPVTEGQLDYEFAYLCNKLRRRAPKQHAELMNVADVEPNPIFDCVVGGVERWEVAAW